MVFEDRWSLMAVVSQHAEDRFHSIHLFMYCIPELTLCT